MSKTYFFILSVGPVQSFIAQARKAQDLFLGCRMISDYCRHAAFAFEREKGKIIFPEVRSNSLTNRFMGTVEIENEEHAKRIGKAVEDAVKSRFVKEGVMAISAGLGGFDVRNITGIEEQLANHLETYWAFSLYDKQQDYAENYRRAERVFGMSKYMRTPAQMAYQGKLDEYSMFEKGYLGETGRKCLVDGERNVKIYRWSEDDRKNKKKKRAHRYWDLLKDKLFLENPEEVVLIGDENKDGKNTSPLVPVSNVPPKFIQDGEGLSAVSFFKRCYVPDGDDDWDLMVENPDFWEKKYVESTFQEKTINTTFPTTACFALLDVIKEMEKKGTENGEARISYFKLKNLLRQARPYDYHKRFPKYRAEDEELFFEENLTDKYFEKHSFDKKELKGLREAQQAFKSALPKNEEEKVALQPYFALVAIDIDGLGKHLKKLDNREAHENLAAILHKFANEINELIEKELARGRVLHAGGDDFLLALNLYCLFSTLRKIEKKWKKHDLPLTYSTAIVITHYKAPLTRAVKTVKAELKVVKERFDAEGKNGVAFSFMLKSGAVTTSYFKQDKLKLLKNLFEALQAGRISPKFIFQFAKNMAEMGFHGDTTPEEQEDLRKFALWELQRLMVRARNEAKMEKKDAVKLAKTLKPLLGEQVLEGGAQLDLDNFLQFLKMAELAAK
ncbi:MAG: hypothetical protein KDD19_29090, partial [Phaeodactylibacter sp.]|nr:hypothetical protein [Phaeodactylibacter sp.]